MLYLLETKEVDIYNSINNAGEIGPPKNEASYRRVKLHDDLYNRLLPYSNSKGRYLLGGEKILHHQRLTVDLRRV